MADLQAVVSHDDPFYEQLQDPSLLFGGKLIQPGLDPLAEARQLLPHGLNGQALGAELGLLITLRDQGTTAVLDPLSALAQLLEADDRGLVGVDQAGLPGVPPAELGGPPPDLRP